MPPHVPYGLRGLPSRLWPKCNRRLRRSYVVTVRWMVIYEYEIPGETLNLSSTNLPRPCSPWESSPLRRNPHGRTGNRTRDLTINSQNLWPQTTRPVRHLMQFIRKDFRFLRCVQTALHGKQRWYVLQPSKSTCRSSWYFGFIQCGMWIFTKFLFKITNVVFGKWITGQTDTNIFFVLCRRFDSDISHKILKFDVGGPRTYITWLDERLLVSENEICFMRVIGCPFQPNGNSAFQHCWL
jgi:hypothetical protein